MKLPQVSQTSWISLHDTIVVGYIPNDTLKITGYWTHSGPIIAINDGVIQIKNATMIDSGDVYLLNNSKLIAQNSNLTFPQSYFYQRSLIAVNHASVIVNNCQFNYSGMSHNLTIAQHAYADFKNIHQNDWTTCGLSGQATLNLSSCNLSGEYILTDSCIANFKKADTLILWHHLPDTALINFTFPNGDTVYNYHFNKTLLGVKGIRYSVNSDSCHNVMWALMPVNGSDVTISNSKIRLIGLFFKANGPVSASKLYNNSTYTNFVAPLSDRNLHLVNCQLQTWNLYAFNGAQLNLDSMQIGELITFNHSVANTLPPFILDGSGGYMGSSDTTLIVSYGAQVYSAVRSEKKSYFIFAYGNVPFLAPQAIAKSVLVSAQSDYLSDPIPYDAATTWVTKIETSSTLFTNMIIPINGSAWIDNGIWGTGWMNFSKYSLYYKPLSGTIWAKITKDSLPEIHHTALANWNTNGLTSGNYLLKLVTKNNLGDSVEAIKPITLINNATSLNNEMDNLFNAQVFPNPTTESLNISTNSHYDYDLVVEISDALGRVIIKQNLHENSQNINVSNFEKGLYNICIRKKEMVVFHNKVIID